MRTGACLIALLLASTATAQTPGTAYHRAPDAIAKALETPPTPAVGVSPDHRTLAIFGREPLPTIANLSKPILRLGGYRIDPATNGQAEVRVQWLNALSFKDIASGRTIAVQLPAGLRYCINSAALRFVPREEMEAQGYGDYLDQVEDLG